MGLGLHTVRLCRPDLEWLCNLQCHVTTWDWVNNGFTVWTQSRVVMQSTMSCDHMGLGEQLIDYVDPIPCGYAIHHVM